MDRSLGWNVPAAHAMHDPSTTYSPMAHVTRPATVGLGVFTQSEDPSMQSVHVVMPAAVANVPSAHSLHFTDPVVLAAVPTSHAMQDVPVKSPDAWYCPAAHGKQPTVTPSTPSAVPTYSPAGHVVTLTLHDVAPVAE